MGEIKHVSRCFAAATQAIRRTLLSRATEGVDNKRGNRSLQNGLTHRQEHRDMF